MKIKYLGLSSFVILATVASCLTALPVSAKARLLGNCGRQKCETLLTRLRTRWPKQVKKYESECTGKNRLGLQVFSNQSEGKRVNFACWEPKAKDGSRFGSSLGELPFPGEESKFSSSWSCDEKECKDRLAKLRNLYPKQIKDYEFSCATHSGSLHLNISNSNNKEVEIECGFFSYNLYDENGDGVNESDRGTTVGIILGKLQLPD